MRQTIRKLSNVGACSKGISAGRGRRWGRSWCKTCSGLCNILQNRFISLQIDVVAKVGWVLAAKSGPSATTQKSFYFWRSCTPAKSHPAGEAYWNLANTTERKTACMAVSHKPWALRRSKAYNACALETINCWICKLIERPLVNVIRGGTSY